VLLVNHCLLGSCSGKRPYGQLVVALRRVRLLADQVPTEPQRNPDGIEISSGLRSRNQSKLALGPAT
jgi:hypothetical protein